MGYKGDIIGIFFRKILSIFLILTAIFSAQNIFANFWFDVNDTIAGNSSEIKTSLIDTWTQIEAKIKKPWWGVLKLHWRAWDDKKSTIEILWYHTKIAWKYTVEIKNYKKDFNVFAWNLSIDKSKIFSSESSVSAKNDTVKIIAEIKDKYWNVIKNHKLKLLSSRYEDLFKSECKTNKNWKCVFEVKSEKEGSSIFTIIDLTENKVLNERVKIIFYTPEEKFAIWWNQYLASLLDWESWWLLDEFDNFWVVSYFEIEFSNDIKINDKDNSMTILAKDADWNIVKDYQGTIKIEIPDDENAILPLGGEYRFKPEDLWKKKFDLATTFTKKWKTTINVYDFSEGQLNESVKWTKEIIIWDKWGSESENKNAIKIKSPTNLSKIASNQIQVNWNAEAFSSLKLYINESLAKENIDVDKDWSFIVTIKWLEDWKNKIHLVEMEWQKRSSETIQIEIDTEAPRINDIKIYPQWEIDVNTKYNITIFSEPKLPKVRVLIDWNIETLTEKAWEEWTYESSLSAPSKKWEYPINIILADNMWNEEEYQNQSSIKTKELKKLPPDKIDTVDTTVKKNEISIKWTEPNSQIEIREYKIYIWKKEDSLEFFWVAKLNDITLKNLDYETEYFIEISALNIEWLESKKSDIKRVKINKKEEDTKESKEEEEEEETHSAAKNIEIESSDSKVTLKWKKLWNDVYNYKIEYWVSRDDLSEYIKTKNDSTEWYVLDLINWLEYYFRVVWIKNDWTETSKRTEIVRWTPNWKWFVIEWGHKSAPKNNNIDKDTKKIWWKLDDTGPEIWFIIAFALLFWDFINRKISSKPQN